MGSTTALGEVNKVMQTGGFGSSAVGRDSITRTTAYSGFQLYNVLDTHRRGKFRERLLWIKAEVAAALNNVRFLDFK